MLDPLTDVSEIVVRKMMGEYLLYVIGKLFGGVYDDRFLVKGALTLRAVLLMVETIYKGTSPMLLVDTEAPSTLTFAILPELSGRRMRNRQPSRQAVSASRASSWEPPWGKAV